MSFLTSFIFGTYTLFLLPVLTAASISNSFLPEWQKGCILTVHCFTPTSPGWHLTKTSLSITLSWMVVQCCRFVSEQSGNDETAIQCPQRSTSAWCSKIWWYCPGEAMDATFRSSFWKRPKTGSRDMSPCDPIQQICGPLSLCLKPSFFPQVQPTSKPWQSRSYLTDWHVIDASPWHCQFEF